MVKRRMPTKKITSSTSRRPTEKEFNDAFDKTIQRHGKALRALGDASVLSKRRKKVEAALRYVHKRYGKALRQLGDASNLGKPKNAA